MVGIGITTKDRPELLQALLDSIHKHTDMSDVKLYVADDTFDKVGVAKKKNECLRELKDCRHIFLMDDDIEIIKEGWVEFFIDEIPKSDHWLFLNDKMHGYLGGNVYQNCGGVFMYMTKRVIDNVGAFNEKFEKYGFEHAEYSQRIYKAGFMLQPYMCKSGTDKYIFAHDYSTPNHKSSITDEEKKECIKNNWGKFFDEPIKSVYLPL